MGDRQRAAVRPCGDAVVGVEMGGMLRAFEAVLVATALVVADRAVAAHGGAVDDVTALRADLRRGSGRGRRLREPLDSLVVCHPPAARGTPGRCALSRGSGQFDDARLLSSPLVAGAHCAGTRLTRAGGYALHSHAVAVSYRFRTGKVVEDLPWTESFIGLLGSATPGRAFRWHRGQKHHSGPYWAAMTRGHVIYGSRLELSRLLFAKIEMRHWPCRPSSGCPTGPARAP